MSIFGAMLLHTAIVYRDGLIISFESISSLAKICAISLGDAIDYAKELGVAVNYAF